MYLIGSNVAKCPLLPYEILSSTNMTDGWERRNGSVLETSIELMMSSQNHLAATYEAAAACPKYPPYSVTPTNERDLRPVQRNTKLSPDLYMVCCFMSSSCCYDWHVSSRIRFKFTKPTSHPVHLLRTAHSHPVYFSSPWDFPPRSPN